MHSNVSVTLVVQHFFKWNHFLKEHSSVMVTCALRFAFKNWNKNKYELINAQSFNIAHSHMNVVVVELEMHLVPLKVLTEQIKDHEYLRRESRLR